MQYPDFLNIALQRRHPALWTVSLAIAVFVVSGLISVNMKQDDNWDLQNYHVYNAFSLLGSRLGTDLWANQQQITFNPLLDLPYYVVARLCLGGYPRLVAFLAGLPFGALILSAVGLNIAVFGRRPRIILIATALGVTGTTVIGEIGTTFGDIPIACLVLLGMAGLVVSVRGDRAWRLACVVAGGALGLAAGLKLTAGLYAPAAFVALLCCRGGNRRRACIAIFTSAWLAGFAPPVCWWGLHLQSTFASPVFPLFNTVFASPWAPATNSLDTRFLPHGPAQWLAYPFFWLRGAPFRVSEGPVRDAHFAAAYIAVLALLARRVWNRAALPPEQTLLLVFFVTAFALWEAAFSILRYAMPLEVLTGTLMALAIDSLVPVGRTRIGLLAAALPVMLAVQSPYDTGRLKRYGRATFEIAAPPYRIARPWPSLVGRPRSWHRSFKDTTRFLSGSPAPAI